METCEMCGADTREIFIDTVYKKEHGVMIPEGETNTKDILIACTKCVFARRKTK